MGGPQREGDEDEVITGTAGTAPEGSDAGKGDDVVGTPGWKAQSGAAQLEHEQDERDAADAGDADSGAGESGPGGTPSYGASGQEGQGADSADRPPGGSG
jgi:hypothetical protein